MIFAVFNTAMRQKNQLGMMMGCGCGIVFLINFFINILENLGVLPQSVTFLPFLSAGGSCIIVSYGLMGIVLSTYRYKNIYPRHLKIGFKFDKTKARKALYVSKMSMCIWTGGTVAVKMCIRDRTEVDVYGFFQMFLSRILDQEPEKLDILQDLIRGDLK